LKRRHAGSGLTCDVEGPDEIDHHHLGEDFWVVRFSSTDRSRSRRDAGAAHHETLLPETPSSLGESLRDRGGIGDVNFTKKTSEGFCPALTEICIDIENANPCSLTRKRLRDRGT